MSSSALVELRLVMADGSQIHAYATTPETGHAAVRMTPELWMMEPRRSWEHPQDPIVLSARVAEGHEGDARSYVAGLVATGWVRALLNGEGGDGRVRHRDDVQGSGNG